jgi:response regulator NasT
MSGQLKFLLVESDAERATALERRLCEIGETIVVRAPAGGPLFDAVTAEAPDAVVVDITRSDRDALDDVRRISRDSPRPIILFVDRDDPGFMEDAIAAGVSAYHVVDGAFPDLKPIVLAAVAMFRKHRQVEADLHKARATLLERETIDRAKAMLIRQRKLDEPQAYRWLRRKAMNESKRIATVAAELLAAASEDASGR